MFSTMFGDIRYSRHDGFISAYNTLYGSAIQQTSTRPTRSSRPGIPIGKASKSCQYCVLIESCPSKVHVDVMEPPSCIKVYFAGSLATVVVNSSMHLPTYS